MPLSEVGKGGNYKPHYQLGDLGVVPKQTEHLLTNVEKSKLKNQTELRSLQKLTKRTIGTQTIDFTKVRTSCEYVDLYWHVFNDSFRV